MVRSSSGFSSSGVSHASGPLSFAGKCARGPRLKSPRMKRDVFRFVVLLGLASSRLAHSAAGPDCAHFGAAITGRDSNGPSFAWSTLPRVPMADPRAAYRIGIWGDSLTSARNFIDAALQSAGIATSTALPSFIQAGIGVSGLSLPLKAACATSGWHTAFAHKVKGGPPTFSQGFVRMESESPGELIFMDFRFPLPDTRLRQLDILYEKAKPDSSLLLGVSIDGQDEMLIPLSRTPARVLRIVPEQAMATVRIRLVTGQVRIHGFLPTYTAAPSVVLDSFSVPGGVLGAWEHVDERYLADTPDKVQDYDLILIQYGTNEGANANFRPAQYAGYLRANLDQVRRLHPYAKCVLIGPPDRGVAGGVAPGAMKYSNVHHQIALAQRQASADYQCASWDWQDAMGGPGTAMQWALMKPPLMQPDLTHMTARGYATSGRLFSKSFPFPKP